MRMRAASENGTHTNVISAGGFKVSGGTLDQADKGE